MKIDEIMDVLKQLAMVQGYYSRLYEGMLKLQKVGNKEWEVLVETLEKQNFKEPVDVVMFIEG